MKAIISHRRLSLNTTLLILFAFTQARTQEDAPLAPLFDDLGSHTHETMTDNPRAQRYFDQGLILHYGFNHAEAVRSFRQAQRLDPDYAMALRGEATTRSVLQEARNMLEGEIAAAQGSYAEVEKHLRDAVSLETSLGYYEPPVWFSPARHTLGAILIDCRGNIRFESQGARPASAAVR